jgi:YD repeat-containing protein
LRELIEDYGTGRFQFWHFYGYDHNGRISVDTTYGEGIMGQRPTDNTNRVIRTFTYDDQGRMIHERVRSDPANGFDYDFYYDVNGNKLYPGQRTYDNKKNFTRTNDIWMFLSRDYSKNNPFVAEEYNSAGYPTVFSSDFGSGYSWLWEVDLRGARLSYSCRPSNYY